MSDVSSVSSSYAAASVPTQAIIQVLKTTLETQAEIMATLLEAMGIGQNIDIQA